MDYKGSYFEELTNEVTTIQVDFVDYDRYGNVDYTEDLEPVILIRASQYTSKNDSESGKYSIYINNIAQHTLHEISLLSNDVVKRMLRRFEQIDERIDKAWKELFKHWGLFTDQKFSALDFQWTFYGYFNIPIEASAGYMDNQNFDKGITTDSFFWDLHDAMMYKQGAVKWILWHLKDHVEIEAESEPESKPESEDLTNEVNEVDSLPSLDNLDSSNKLSLMQVAMVYQYLKLTINSEHEGNDIALRYGWKSGKKLKQNFDSLHTTRERTTLKTDHITAYRNKSNDFKKTIFHLNSLNKVEEAKEAERDFRTLQSTYSHLFD